MADPREFLGQLANVHKQREAQRSTTATAYRWGKLDRRTRHFQPPALSGDAEIVESQELMHSRVRNEAINNAQISRIIEALTDLVIGQQMQTLADPFDTFLNVRDLTEGKLDSILQVALESDELFEEWFSDPEQFSANGKMSGPDVQRLMLGECVKVGDSFLLECMSDDPDRIIPLCYQLIEREQLDQSLDRPATPDQKAIVGGIELDSFGGEVGYHVLDAHPGDNLTRISSGTASAFIPASRMKHLFLFKRPTQNIGATWLSAIGQNNFDRDKFIGTELQSAAKAALLALIHITDRPDLADLNMHDGVDDSDAWGDEVKMGSSPLAMTVKPGEDVKMIESSRPNSTANNFIDILDHDMAAGGGLSYYTLTGRFEKTNYVGFRGALLSEDQHIRPLQSWFGRHIALPVRRRFTEIAAALGLFSFVTPAQFRKDRRRYQRFDALGAGRQLLDPDTETEAAIGALRAGLTTLKLECARRGLHWIRVLRQAALENRVAELLGLVLDHSKGQGGQADTTTRDNRKKRQEETAQ